MKEGKVYNMPMVFIRILYFHDKKPPYIDQEQFPRIAWVSPQVVSPLRVYCSWDKSLQPNEKEYIKDQIELSLQQPARDLPSQCNLVTIPCNQSACGTSPPVCAIL